MIDQLSSILCILHEKVIASLKKSVMENSKNGRVLRKRVEGVRGTEGDAERERERGRMMRD